MPDDKNTELLENAMTQPKKVIVDDKTVEQHSLEDMIALDKYIETKKAMRKRSLGIRFAKMQAGGASR